MIFRAIPKEQAITLVIKNHYLHRRAPISWAWGIFPTDEFTLEAPIGCLTVGKPCTWSTMCGVVGENKEQMNNKDARSKDVFELNRLWVSDALPKNTESRFIGWCLRELKRLYPHIILVSYADGAMNHVGYVYQATNWLYTGLSAAFVDINLPGYSDYRSVPKERRGEKIGNRRAWADDPAAIRKPRSRKHRYVWFANAADRALLKWPVCDYPKIGAEKH